jgi:hypothetical protein
MRSTRLDRMSVTMDADSSLSSLQLHEHVTAAGDGC